MVFNCIFKRFGQPTKGEEQARNKISWLIKSFFSFEQNIYLERKYFSMLTKKYPFSSLCYTYGGPHSILKSICLNLLPHDDSKEDKLIRNSAVDFYHDNVRSTTY